LRQRRNAIAAPANKIGAHAISGQIEVHLQREPPSARLTRAGRLTIIRLKLRVQLALRPSMRWARERLVHELAVDQLSASFFRLSEPLGEGGSPRRGTRLGERGGLRAHDVIIGRMAGSRTLCRWTAPLSPVARPATRPRARCIGRGNGTRTRSRGRTADPRCPRPRTTPQTARAEAPPGSSVSRRGYTRAPLDNHYRSRMTRGRDPRSDQMGVAGAPARARLRFAHQ
jgi:hypothetical protein